VGVPKSYGIASGVGATSDVGIHLFLDQALQMKQSLVLVKGLIRVLE
jgi:hypothetical protein